MADAKVLIDGIEHEVPALSSFDMDEYQILYDLSKLTVIDFATEDEDQITRNYWNPGYQRALLIVAYLRANPGSKRIDAEKMIGKVKLADVIEKEDDAGPPDLTNGQHQDEAGSSSRSVPSGEPSRSDSDAIPEGLHERTGIGRSDKSQDKGRELLDRGSRLT